MKSTLKSTLNADVQGAEKLSAPSGAEPLFFISPLTRTRRIREQLVKGWFLAAGLSAIFILLYIFGLLLWNGLQTFREVPLASFFLSSDWNPSAYGEPAYGILSLVTGTLMVSAGAMIIAVPLGIVTAAFIAEIASPGLREILKPAIELLAGIPSVVIGFFGIVWMGPAIARIFGLDSGLNALNGSILLAFMALPTIISVSEDAIRSVPDEYRQASLALGVTRWETLVRVVLPAALSGIIASVMLGFGRAIGETMTVLMVTGNALEMPSGFFDSVRTMTANLAIELGEVPFGSLHFYSLYSVGLVLFLMTLLVNMIADRIARRYTVHN